jgi:AraC-like DNA-binding protein
MDSIKDLYFAIVFFSGILGFLVAIILIFFNRTEGLPSRLLAAFLICFGLLAFNYALMTTRFFLSFPHFWRVLGFASFCYSPLAYLYVRTTLQQSYHLRRSDLLLFIPAMLHPLALTPFFIQSAEEKLNILNQVMEDPRLIILEPESLLPEAGAFFLRIAVGVAATVGQFVMLYQWKKRYESRMLGEKQNQEMYRWLCTFTVVLAIFWLLVIAQVMLNGLFSQTLNTTLIFTIAGTILFVSVYLLMQPSILYGIKGWRRAPAGQDQAEAEEGAKEEVSAKKYHLSPEHGQFYRDALETHFSQTKAFRKAGYSIGDLSSELNFPAYQLSAFINQEYTKNFNELVNEYRVDYLVRKSKSSDDFSQYTLEALGKEAGFNSRAAFIAAVKKVTGRTPSEVFGRRGNAEKE